MNTRNMPPKVRWSILERDHFACVYCGRTVADSVKLHVDHVIPWSDGGTDDPGNLVTACEDCNLGKRARVAALPRAAADAYAGACCPTRLRIAAIAVQLSIPYRQSADDAARRLGSMAPPPARYDTRWMTVVRTNPDPYLMWLAASMQHAVADDEGGLLPFARA